MAWRNRSDSLSTAQARASRPGMTEVQEKMDGVVVEWASRIPVDQIPALVVFLATRLLTEGHANRGAERDGGSTEESGKLLTAGELAGRLNLPESWVRSEERTGRIPSVRLGKYVRFKTSDVERALADRQRRGM
jgi:excisionase family DNA binding protein